jgi:hypothetical protein
MCSEYDIDDRRLPKYFPFVLLCETTTHGYLKTRVSLFDGDKVA